MKEFKLNQETLKNAESVAEIEAILDSALKLKGSHGHGTLSTLLTGYLQKPFNEDDPEVLDEIDQVAGFCEDLGRMIARVNMSHLNK
ncbi:hypothetical protein GF357_03145 [Candidatus Dojkabacteria bacterium]|nr:hypothetical protein [Candidatus Dojkabacteria bacterium]